MKTNVNENSIRSISRHRASGKSQTQKERIMQIMITSGKKQTARQIEAALNFGVLDDLYKIKQGAVSGRLNELVGDEKLSVIERKKDRKGDWVNVYGLPVKKRKLKMAS